MSANARPLRLLRLLRLVAEIERTRDPVDCGGETVRMIFAPSENDPHQLRTLEVEAVELPRGGWSREEFNTLRDIQSEAPTLPFAWRDVVWTPSRVERQDDADADADVLAAAEALATADAALQSAQPGSHDEDACELAREEAVTAILEAVAKRRPLEDPEPTMAPRKLGSVSSLLGDGDGRPF